MFRNPDTRELVNLASALDYLCNSDLLAKKLRTAGYNPSSFDFEIIMGVLADCIAVSLKA